MRTALLWKNSGRPCVSSTWRWRRLVLGSVDSAAQTVRHATCSGALPRKQVSRDDGDSHQQVVRIRPTNEHRKGVRLRTPTRVIPHVRVGRSESCRLALNSDEPEGPPSALLSM
jgi:hypothetical protein